MHPANTVRIIIYPPAKVVATSAGQHVSEKNRQSKVDPADKK